ncbi:hypothetical protein [Nocardiopsis potens]|uniref:hypothetical protein n=1 Tax=Nocardiopsis potens TaxID=1246458 RepID=UPI00034B4C89|nr:hypothetical protein [Nocardiopsis potens]
MPTVHETAAELADVLLYTPDAAYPWQVAGAGTARMDDAEARTHLAVLHGAEGRTAEAALALAKVRDTARAVEHLQIEVDGGRVRLTPAGRRMERAAALRVLEQEYRLTRGEAEALLRQARRATRAARRAELYGPGGPER